MKAPDNDVNKLAEKYATYDQINDGGYPVPIIDGDKKDAFIAGFTAASNKTAAGMRWVKCSERLPEKKHGNVIIKFLGNAWYGHFENENSVMYIPAQAHYYPKSTWEKAEWLDENSPASGKWTDKEFTMKDVKSIYANRKQETKSHIKKSLSSTGERETVKK